MRVLALGSSEFGGDWHPLAALISALADRGHKIQVAGDPVLASWIEQDGMEVRISSVEPGYDRFAQQRTHRGAPKTFREEHLQAEWAQAQAKDSLAVLREFEPDFLLTSLLKLPLAIELKRRTGIPVCFLNPSIYFGDEDGKQFSRNLADRAVSRVEQLL